ncbi:MAG: hypothetical protein KAT12_07475 [Gammaproteobacteria bacterium]|nr:hypothetical protein [Gammaproteobacteria bacterium]
MKFIFMLLILFVLTDPVLAKPAGSTSECLQMYGTYMNEYGASRFIPDEQMLDFIGRCIPAATVNTPGSQSNPRHQKLLRILNNNRNTETVKA